MPWLGLNKRFGIETHAALTMRRDTALMEAAKDAGKEVPKIKPLANWRLHG
jgi:hypothetical protein